MSEQFTQLEPTKFRFTDGDGRDFCLDPIETLITISEIRQQFDADRKSGCAKPFQYVADFRKWLSEHPDCPNDVTLGEADAVWTQVDLEYAAGKKRQLDLMNSFASTEPTPSASPPGSLSDSTPEFDELEPAKT